MATVHSALAATDDARGVFAATSPTLGEITSRVMRSMPLTKLAELIRIPVPQAYRYATLAGNPSGEHRRLPWDLVVPITQATGDFGILDWQEDQVGRVAVVRASAGGGVASLLAAVAGVGREVSDVQRVTAEALANGALESSEAVALDAELAETARAIEAMRRAVQAAARKPGAKVAR